MRRMGFDSHFINMIMLCITSLQYYASINGELVPERGLLQGDPLSPYLFIICAKGLSVMLKQVEESGHLHGCRISRGTSSISHLLFVDDSLFFFNASKQECCKMQSILGEYEKISGKVVNFQKSGIFFSGNVPEALRSSISNKLGVYARSFKYREIFWTTLPYWHKQKGHFFLPTGDDVEKDPRVEI